MPRRSTRFALLPFALVLLVPLAAGCGGGSGASGVTLDPTGQSQPDPTPAGLIADGQGRADLAFGGYTLLVDGEQASLTPWRTGANNDDLYFLGIDRFLSPASMRVTGIAVTGTEVQVHWRFTHPFPAPNLFAPPSGRNRADLGVAARILLLEEVPAGQVGDRTFFGTAIANTDLLLNPDGYWQPRGLLEAGTANANTFPYQLVVDEGANAGNGNRDDHAGGNGGRGNYDPSIGGWQRANMGGDSASWTGYGVIHQGQSASGVLRLDRAQFTPGTPRAIELGVVAKYNDPRGVPDPRSKRLPPDFPDPFFFAYRMPHGALDVEQVLIDTPPAIPGGDPTATTVVRARVRDWDARAVPTLEADLANDPLVDTIYPDEAGAPTVAVSAPAITAIEPEGTELDPGTRSGLPGDEIVYEATLTATNSPADGTYPALVRVTDPGVLSANRRNYTFDLDQNLVPITDPSQQVDPITYQALAVVVSSGPNNPPTCDGVAPSTGFLEAGGTFTVNLSQIVDDSANLRVRFEYTGPSNSSTGEVTIPVSGLGAESAFNPFTDSRLTPRLTPPTQLGAYQLQVRLSDGVNVVDCGPFPFTVGVPGQCPMVSSTATNLGPLPGDPDYQNFDGILLYEDDSDDIEKNGIGTTDLAGFRNNGADFLLQGNVNQDFWRVTYDLDFGLEAEQLTMNYPGTGFANRAHHYEVDGNGRVLWVASNITQDESDPGLEADEIYASAGMVIHFFDTNGTLPVTADKGTINVGQRVVAMAIGHDNAVWVLDSTNTMRRYTGAPGGTTYSEDTTAAFSLTTASAGALTGAIVEDFDINFYNQAFFVATRRANGQMDLWRFECNGTYNASVEGNPNPATNLFPDDEVDRGDIVIDNYNSSGGILTGPQDAQIIVTGDNGGGETLNNDAGLSITITARLQRSSVTIGQDGAGRTSFLYGLNQMITTETLSINDPLWAEDWVEVYGSVTGWQ